MLAGGFGIMSKDPTRCMSHHINRYTYSCLSLSRCLVLNLKAGMLARLPDTCLEALAVHGASFSLAEEWTP